MTATPKNLGDVSFDWLQASLRKAYPEANLQSMKIDSSVGDLGYLGSIGRIDLVFDTEIDDLPKSLIIKFPSDNDETFAHGSQLGAYAKEASFYRHLANSGTGRAPRHYFSVIEPDTGDFVLAIEDLGDHRFVKQTEGATYHDCEMVMKAMARMHAAHWEDDSLGGDWLGSIADWGEANKPLIESGLPLYQQNFSEYIDHQWFLDNWALGAKAYGDVCNHLASGRTTLMHGDSHIRNLAFDDSHTEPVRFYDWQLCCRGPAAYDLVYFFVNSLQVADQKAHLEGLIDVYYRTLASEIPDYSMADLKRDMAYSSLTFWGFIAWLGNILPPNEATIELVRETGPRFMNLMEYLDSANLLQEFR